MATERLQVILQMSAGQYKKEAREAAAATGIWARRRSACVSRHLPAGRNSWSMRARPATNCSTGSPRTRRHPRGSRGRTVRGDGSSNERGIQEGTVMSWDRGGTIRIIRINASGPQVVAEWVSDNGRRFEDGGAHFVPCETGDVIQVFVDHGDSEPHDVAYARLAVGLVDHYGSRAPQEATAGVIDEAITGDYVDGTSSGAINMTTGQEPGDVMLMMLSSRSETGDTFPASFPSGWTLLVNKFQYGNKLMSLLYKVCDGTEPASYTLTSDQPTRWTGAVWVVRSDRDYSVHPPEVGTPAAVESPNSSTPIDPPSVTPSTPGKYLVFACAAHSHATKVPTAGPDNYELSSVLQSSLIASFGGSITAGLDVWRRFVNISTSEDPGPIFYTGDFGRAMGAVAVAVRV